MAYAVIRVTTRGTPTRFGSSSRVQSNFVFIENFINVVVRAGTEVDLAIFVDSVGRNTHWPALMPKYSSHFINCANDFTASADMVLDDRTGLANNQKINTLDNTMKCTKHLIFFLSAALVAPATYAEMNASGAIDLSLEELMNVVVTSISKKSQTIAETAAAVYVINAEDIRRSGATSIPEALRLAPGVQVAAIGNNKWAVSIRGQSDRFANKLLVLVDGRSVYHPMFSGVVWENLDVPMENIDRIEVIRGPGASIWGANAVNGVINILTRSPFDSRGGQVAVAAGSGLKGQGYARYNWRPDPDTAIQVYASARDSGASRFAGGGKGVDDWQTRNAGFKLEHLRSEGTFRIEGGLSSSHAGDEIVTITDAGIMPLRHTQKIDSGHLLGRWDGPRSESRQDSFQAYVEHEDYDHTILGQHRIGFDLEYQQKRRAATDHELIWGLGYRYSQDRIDNSALVTMVDRERSTSLYSAFLQDEITLQPDRWRLTLGARLEHNEYTGFALQPNARLLWTPSMQTSIWLSLAHAIRNPSRVERGGIVSLPLSAVSALRMDNGDTAEEKLNALDLGWRHQFSQALSLDLAGFYYRYDKLRDASISGFPVFQPGGYALIPAINRNANKGTARGVEASLDWRPRPKWRVQAAYSYLNTRIDIGEGSLPSSYADTTPEHLLSLRSSLDLSHDLRWDAWLRRVGRVDSYRIPAYTTLDMRLAWQVDRNLEISLVGQNLLDRSHPEYDSSFILSTPSEIERSVYVKANWKF